LTLTYTESLSNFAFEYNLRRYNKDKGKRTGGGHGLLRNIGV
jgi:hypothetical protein